MIDLLRGMRIIAISQFGAGPFGTMHLADLGAEVIKIESRQIGGDVARSVPPYAYKDDSLYFQSLNRNKRSLTLDLKHPDGQRILHELVAVSDAVFSNLRGDQPEKLGLMYDQLKAYNPRVVCVSLSGYGMTGPRYAEPGYDYLMQAYAGWMSLTGDPSSPPAKSGISMVDLSAGAVAMVGLLAGIIHARQTGEGCDIDCSLLDAAVSMLNYVAIWTLNHEEYEPQRLPDSAHQSLYPAQVFPTKDGYIVVCCFKEKFWQALTVAMDAPELGADPRFASFRTRYEHRAVLIADLKRRFMAHTTGEWMARLQGDIPCAPVNSVREALSDEQVRARGMIVEVEHPELGTLQEVNTAIRVLNGVAHRRPAPALGADSEPILRDILGYDSAEIARLAEDGVI
jgi:crotonobetainyl-CoA:carnitine CoA-transferase CaiB-like acyl-CoA transferase